LFENTSRDHDHDHVFLHHPIFSPSSNPFVSGLRQFQTPPSCLPHYQIQQNPINLTSRRFFYRRLDFASASGSIDFASSVPAGGQPLPSPLPHHQIQQIPINLTSRRFFYKRLDFASASGSIDFASSVPAGGQPSPSSSPSSRYPVPQYVVVFIYFQPPIHQEHITWFRVGHASNAFWAFLFSSPPSPLRVRPTLTQYTQNVPNSYPEQLENDPRILLRAKYSESSGLRGKFR
jgi:hypothetical protein